VIAENATGLIVAPGDAEALVRAMTKLAGDRELRLAMGRAGRRRYEAQFRADIAAKRLLDAVVARVTPSAQTPR
jgi:glycosyltransferase involved in cell wall biosynthesis